MGSVATTFFGSSLRIDPAYPPIPNESTAQDSGFDTYDIMDIYRDLANVSSPSNGLDLFFGLLTSSRYAIPLATLGDPSLAQSVADAITFQHGILWAQFLSWEYRVPAASPSAMNFTNNPPQEGINTKLYPGTAITTPGRSRVVQDPVATRLLEVLLGATLIFSLLGWLFLPSAKLLPPRSLTSIASVAALLADGNLLQYLDAVAFSSGPVFRIGWGRGNLGESFGVCVEPSSSVEKIDKPLLWEGKQEMRRERGLHTRYTRPT